MFAVLFHLIYYSVINCDLEIFITGSGISEHGKSCIDEMHSKESFVSKRFRNGKSKSRFILIQKNLDLLFKYCENRRDSIYIPRNIDQP